MVVKQKTTALRETVHFRIVFIANINYRRGSVKKYVLLKFVCCWHTRAKQRCI